MDILERLNWVDILVLGIIGRALFIGLGRGFTTELFKLIGITLALYITLHYCTGLASFFHEKLRLPEELTVIFAFVILWVLVVVAFKFIRDALLMMLHIEPHPILNKWGGLITSMFRGLLIASMLLVFFRIAGLETFNNYTRKSLVGSHVAPLAPSMYEAFFENIIVKFFPREKLNISVLKGINTRRVKE